MTEVFWGRQVCCCDSVSCCWPAVRAVWLDGCFVDRAVICLSANVGVQAKPLQLRSTSPFAFVLFRTGDRENLVGSLVVSWLQTSVSRSQGGLPLLQCCCDLLCVGLTPYWTRSSISSLIAFCWMHLLDQLLMPERVLSSRFPCRHNIFSVQLHTM